MTMEKPNSWVPCYKLNIARSAWWYINTVHWPLSRFWNWASLGANNPTNIAMPMDWMIIHAHVNKTDAYAIILVNYHSRNCRSSMAIKGKPIPIHAHKVGINVTWQYEPFLHSEYKLLINGLF